MYSSGGGLRDWTKLSTSENWVDWNCRVGTDGMGRFFLCHQMFPQNVSLHLVFAWVWPTGPRLAVVALRAQPDGPSCCRVLQRTNERLHQQLLLRFLLFRKVSPCLWWSAHVMIHHVHSNLAFARLLGLVVILALCAPPERLSCLWILERPHQILCARHLLCFCQLWVALAAGWGVGCADAGWKRVIELGGDIDGYWTTFDPHGWLGAIQWVFVQDVSFNPVLARLGVRTEVIALDALPVRLARVNVLQWSHKCVHLLLGQPAWLLFHLFHWFCSRSCGWCRGLIGQVSDSWRLLLVVFLLWSCLVDLRFGGWLIILRFWRLLVGLRLCRVKCVTSFHPRMTFPDRVGALWRSWSLCSCLLLLLLGGNLGVQRVYMVLQHVTLHFELARLGWFIEIVALSALPECLVGLWVL